MKKRQPLTELRQEPVDEYRVIFLGDPESGKSNIVYRMIRPDADLHTFDGTASPSLSIFECNTQTANQRRVRLNIWDFGAQNIVHSTYRMFMTNAALYIIVLNARNADLDEQAERWLKIVKNNAGDAPVLLIINKLDQNPSASINTVALLKTYPQILGVIRISARTFSQQEFESHVTKPLLHQINQMDSLTPTHPAHKELRDALNRLRTRKKYINIGSYMALCEQYGVTDDSESLILLEQLCRLGICFHIGDTTTESLVVLDPEWIIKAFYSIIGNTHLDIENGFARLADIQYLLIHVGYEHQHIIYLIQYFNQFSLAVSINENDLFFPSLCSLNSHPVLQEYTNDSTVQEFCLEYEFLPADVLYKLMRELHGTLDKETVWRLGARFSWPDDGDSAVVATEGNRIRILIRCINKARSPRVCLDRIRRQLGGVHRRLSLEDPAVYVDYEWNGIKERFSYDGLEKALRDGPESIYSVAFNSFIQVRDILDHTTRFIQKENDKLCADLARILTRMAAHPGLRRIHEDDLNMTLRDHLDIMGYHIAAQRRLKVRNDRGGIHDADVVLMNDDKSPWTVMEALRIRDGRTRFWNEHLRKLLVYYAPFDLPVRFLISYVECDRAQYSLLMDRYKFHLDNFISAEFERIPNSTREQFVDPCLSVISSIYMIGGKPVTVYHYFVLMHGENDSLPEDMEAWMKEFEAEINREQKNFNPGNASYISLEDGKVKNPSKSTESEHPEDSAKDTDPEYKEPPASTEYRVVLLGDGEAGKSLVLHRLKHPDCEPAEFPGNVTPGIDIASKEYTINEKKVRVNYWDFGGQEILHPLHRMFLVRQTLYVILLNTRNDNQDDRAIFWLRFVQTYAAGAPVILVLNKVDQNDQAALNEQLLMEQFPNIRAVLRLSALIWPRAKFEDEFENKITDQIEKLLDKHNTFNEQEMKIIQEIRSRKGSSKQISLKDFRKICMDVDPEKPIPYISLLNRFNAVGICVFFEKKSETQTQMLLDPEWITTAIYKILEMRSELKENGIVSHDAIGTLFDNDPSGEYGREDVGFVLNVMRTFQLSYPRANQNEEFIPMLCRHSEPEEVKAFIADSSTREMQLRYEYLPTDVLYRLIVSRSGELDQEKVWRFGAIFDKSENCSAVIRRDGDTLTVCTGIRRSTAEQEETELTGSAIESGEAVPAKNAEETAEYMAALLGEIQKGTVFNESGRMSGADNGICTGRIKERLIGYKYDNQKEFFDYDRLKLSKENQLYYVMSKCKRAPVYIQDILDQADTSAEREKDELLRHTLAGCIDLQKDKVFWKENEDTRNRQLMRRISQQFHVLDQTQGGESGSGNSTGELDGEIRLEHDLPWVVLEALNIKNDFKKSATNWAFHLSKLMESYNTSGYRYLLLVSYVECAEDNFGACRDYYFDKLLNGRPGETWDRPERCETEFIKGCPQMIHVTKADYKRNDTITSVYHFMVHIPGYSPKKKSSTKKSTSKAKKKTTAPESIPQPATP